MIEKKQVAVQTKTVSSTKLVGATALLVGVALGGYLLNMAGAVSTCNISTCTLNSRLSTVARQIITEVSSKVSEADWKLVFTPESGVTVQNLMADINNGKEVKVVIESKSENGGFQWSSYTCNQLLASVTLGQEVVTCNTASFLDASGSKDFAYQVYSYTFSTQSNGLLNFIKYDKSGRIVDSGVIGMGPKESGQMYLVKWYSKK